MTGQRRAKTCRFDMLPPPGEALWALVVESERRVAGDVFFKNGHMDRDWRRSDSMVGNVAIEQVRLKLGRIWLKNLVK